MTTSPVPLRLSDHLLDKAFGGFMHYLARPASHIASITFGSYMRRVHKVKRKLLS